MAKKQAISDDEAKLLAATVEVAVMTSKQLGAMTLPRKLHGAFLTNLVIELLYATGKDCIDIDGFLAECRKAMLAEDEEAKND